MAIQIDNLESVNFTITVSKGFKLRMMIGVWLISLGIRITGAHCDIKADEQ